MDAVSPHLFDLLPLLLGGDDSPGDPQALLEHGHARLGLAALDLGQARPLLGLTALQLLDQTLVVALHLLHLLLRAHTHTHKERETSYYPCRNIHINSNISLCL